MGTDQSKEEINTLTDVKGFVTGLNYDPEEACATAFAGREFTSRKDEIKNHLDYILLENSAINKRGIKFNSYMTILAGVTYVFFAYRLGIPPPINEGGLVQAMCGFVTLAFGIRTLSYGLRYYGNRTYSRSLESELQNIE